MNEREAKAGRGDGSGESFQVGQRLASLAGTQRVLEAIISSRPRQRQPARPAAGRCRQWTDAETRFLKGPGKPGRLWEAGLAAVWSGWQGPKPAGQLLRVATPPGTDLFRAVSSESACRRVPPAMAVLQTPAPFDSRFATRMVDLLSR